MSSNIGWMKRLEGSSFLTDLMNHWISLFYLNVKSLGTVGYTEDGEHCVTVGPGWEMFADQMTYFANG